MTSSKRAKGACAFCLSIFLLALATACDERGADNTSDAAAALPPPIARDWDAIRARDTLVALVTFNSTGYFLYRGEPMGYEYELLRHFAEDHDLELRTIVVRDRGQLFPFLNHGEGDVVAARLVPMADDTARVAFTRPLYTTEPTLVQQRVPAEPLPDTVSLRARLIRDPAQLGGERVYLPQSSAYYETLAELEDSVSGDIHVVEVEGALSSEPLIRSVSRGEVEFTVAPENLAELQQSYFTNIAVRPIVGPRHRVAWGIRRNAPALQTALDSWLAEQHEEGLLEELYRRYFIDRRGYRERIRSEYLTSETGKISDYDELLRRFAEEIGWDWRLLASQAYQESRFDPTARSWAGARGLLQLMPATAREQGVRDPTDPEDNVRGAVRYLRWLSEQWTDDIPDPTERLKFVLASYNTGMGHVQDAQRLAEKHGGDPKRWEDVATWLLQKSKRNVYTDPVVKYGFARGLEPVTYVSQVLDRWEHYRQMVEERLGEEQSQESQPVQ